MPVRIVELLNPGGFLRAGDTIVAVDGKAIEDQLDLHFLLAGTESIRLTVRRSNGRQAVRRIHPATIERSGPVLEPMEFRRCASQCIFCFVDQMPAGLRGSLYLKDDDYRLSFLFGNFITLNDISGRELERIIRCNLSPLFVSVHATDPAIRRRLFGRPMRHEILETIASLARAGILMHAQIVLVPGVNDGAVLERTVDDLATLYPACRTVAIVPVGLTRHRSGLADIRSVTAAAARGLIDWAGAKSSALKRSFGADGFLHLSDEFYLLARRLFPPAGAYGVFDQLSNGVGMCRMFLDEVAGRARVLERSRYPVRGSLTLVTGRLGAKFMARDVLPLIARNLPGLALQLLPVDNRIFGSPVGVSGLLAGADVVAAAERSGVAGRCLVLPPNAVNHEGFMIDDMRPGAIGRRLGVRVVVPRRHFLERAVLRAGEGEEKQ